jgi:sugar lactone lactonase YvrE
MMLHDNHALVQCHSDPYRLAMTTTTKRLALLAPVLAACGSTANTTQSDPPADEPTFLARFDPSKGELPEGLFVDGDIAYVGFAPLGTIVTVDLRGGGVRSFGSIPPVPANAGFLLGIALDARRNVYVGFGGGDGAAVPNGIYRIPADGGAVAEPFAADPAMGFPNGLVFDDRGVLFVADSGGTIFQVDADGTVTPWLSGEPTLAPPATPCHYAAPFPIGANGLVASHGAFYVANTNAGQIVRIPINDDGSPGHAAIVAGPDCDRLGAIDGLTVDADGNLLAAINVQNKLVRVSRDGRTITDVFAGKPLDTPASVTVSAGTLYVTNAAFFDTTAPTPGLLAYPLDER